MNLKYVKQLVNQASHLVCLLGIKTSTDCGCLHYRQEDGLYELEKRYGRSPEEIFSSAFFNTRPKQFFQFYQEQLLQKMGSPDACMSALALMEQSRTLKSIITRELFSLPKRAGCQHVIELHGSIFENRCPRCGESYNITYMKEARGVPLCQKCRIPVRPLVRLLGDRFDGRRITEAAEELARADVLLILGCHMHSSLVSYCLPYFRGKCVILVNEDKYFHDCEADLVYHMKPRDFLPMIRDVPDGQGKSIAGRPLLQFPQDRAVAHVKYTALGHAGDSECPPNAV